MGTLALPIAVWHGSLDDSFALAAAVQHNCECLHNEAGVVIEKCSAHKIYDLQRALNGLLFARHLLPVLRAQEFGRTRKGNGK